MKLLVDLQLHSWKWLGVRWTKENEKRKKKKLFEINFMKIQNCFPEFFFFFCLSFLLFFCFVFVFVSNFFTFQYQQYQPSFLLFFSSNWIQIRGNKSLMKSFFKKPEEKKKISPCYLIINQTNMSAQKKRLRFVALPFHFPNFTWFKIQKSKCNMIFGIFHQFNHIIQWFQTAFIWFSSFGIILVVCETFFFFLFSMSKMKESKETIMHFDLFWVVFFFFNHFIIIKIFHYFISYFLFLISYEIHKKLFEIN